VISSRSKLLLTITVIATVMALSLFAIPAFAEPGGRIKVGDTLNINSLRAVALRKIDNTIVEVNASVKLTVEVVAGKNCTLRLEISSGTIEINRTEYSVDVGKGISTPLRAGKGLIVLRGIAYDAGVKVYFKFEGLLDIRKGNVVLVAKGPVKIGDAFYGLRFLALVKRA